MTYFYKSLTAGKYDQIQCKILPKMLQPSGNLFLAFLTQTTGLLNHLKPLLCYVMLCNGKEEEWMLDAGSGTHTHRYGVSDFIFLASAYENVCLIFPLKSVRSV